MGRHKKGDVRLRGNRVISDQNEDKGGVEEITLLPYVENLIWGLKGGGVWFHIVSEQRRKKVTYLVRRKGAAEKGDYYTAREKLPGGSILLRGGHWVHLQKPG